MRPIISWGIALAISTVSVCVAQEDNKMPNRADANKSGQEKSKNVHKERIGSSEYKLSEERISRIREVVQKFYDNHSDLQSDDIQREIREEIKKFVPLTPAQKADTRPLTEIQASLSGKVNEKYKSDPAQIRKQAEMEAEKKYPLAKRNEEVKVYYKRGQAVISATGRFYGLGLGGKSVRLNSRNVPVFDMIPESKALFDRKFNAEFKKAYVDEKLQDYYKERQKYSEALFAAEYARIRSNNEKLGYIYRIRSWVTAEDVLKSLMPDMIRKYKLRAEKERLEQEARKKEKGEAGQDENNSGGNNSDDDVE